MKPSVTARSILSLDFVGAFRQSCKPQDNRTPGGEHRACGFGILAGTEFETCLLAPEGLPHGAVQKGCSWQFELQLQHVVPQSPNDDLLFLRNSNKCSANSDALLS